MKILIIFLILLCSFCTFPEELSKDWDIGKITYSRPETFCVYGQTIFKVLESNRLDILNTSISTNGNLGCVGDTIKIYRVPQSGQWSFNH